MTMKTTTTIKRYSEMIQISTFEERFEYLKLNGSVGVSTFGFDRYFNQRFYRSKEWKDIRDYIIIRDGCCDLGISDHLISGRVLIHHMNPISIEDIEDSSKYLLDPEYLVCVSHITHNAIHFGDKDLLIKDYVERRLNDTCPWRR